MQREEKTNLLKRSIVLQGLLEKDFLVLADKTKLISLPAKMVLFDEGDEAQASYIIQSGQISISTESREIALLSDGEIIGEMAIIDDGLRSATATAVVDTTLLEIKKEDFQSTLMNDAKSVPKILKILCKRLRDSDQKLANDYTIMTTLIHDINNSLTAFSAARVIKKIAEENGNDTIKVFADIMIKAQSSLSEMIKNALHNYKHNEVLSNRNDTNIIETIDQAINIHLANHKDLEKIQIKCEFPESMPAIHHNKNDIIRVLTNLIVNAAQASGEGNDINVSAKFSKDKCLINIQDHGPGIPQIIQKSIFNPGFTSKPNGNGLGLFSCKNIIEELHHGHVSFTTEINRGTVFTIELPAN
ncbi:MAG: hypothetical protein COA79_19445 [Planctomycetota bacterium]|nr:MAG: hypothetical protein COA79_19445 [Planctomycetota bacterium]